MDLKGKNLDSVNCEGNYIAFSKNVINGYSIDHLENGHNVMYTSGT
ncbi:MAG: hypothetical protein WCG98_05230 [bacterium]